MEYTNTCLAACNGAVVECEGKCPCKLKYEVPKLAEPALFNDEEEFVFEEEDLVLIAQLESLSSTDGSKFTSSAPNMLGGNISSFHLH